MTFIQERVHFISIQESSIYFSVFDYMIPKGHFVPVQVIPVFIPNEIIVLVQNFIIMLTENELCSRLKMLNGIFFSEWRMHI